MSITAPLIDSFGRVHTDLRVSVTDRCNMRCLYCMPAAGVEFKPHDAILRFEEIDRFVRVAVRLGIRRVRMTGGEPLVRKGICRLVEMLAAVPGIDELAMTTNGILLGQYANALKSAGIACLNVSLDTLDPGRFQGIARRDELPHVLAGIEAACRAGFRQVKLNVVAIRGRSEADVVPLARFALDRGLELRFIELMPLDGDDRWRADMVLPAGEILRLLADGIGPLEPVVEPDSHAAATHYRFVEGSDGSETSCRTDFQSVRGERNGLKIRPTRSGGRIGLIRTVSRPFCDRCSRLRLTADGRLLNCLFSREQWDVQALLRRGGSDEDLAALVRAAVEAKKECRGTQAGALAPTDRSMHQIGG